MNKKKIITLISVVVFLLVTVFVVTGCTTKKKLVENKVTVTFNLQGGGVVTFSPREINKGETITKPSAAPIKPGFTFKYWSVEINGSEFNFAKPINESLTLYAVWEAIPKVTVTFDLQGGTGVFSSIKVNAGETITKPSTVPTKPGHTFKYWSSEINGTEFNFTNLINDNLTLYAVWEPQTKTVTFITYEGEEVDETTLTGAPSVVQAQTVNYGALLDNTGEMLFLTSVSHNFKYWSKTKNGPEFDVRTETITEDLTLHAVWEVKEYTVTFNTQYDAITIPSQTVKHGKEVVDPRTIGIAMYHPVYSFKFFSLSNDGLTGEYNFTNKVTENLTIYGVWEKEAVKQMALGGNHTLVLTNNNKLFAFGSNSFGQLGLGDKVDRNVPNKLDSSHFGGKQIKQVAAGYDHSLILTEDDEVYAFGRNGTGQLGLGDKVNRDTPTKLDSSHFDGKQIKQVAAGKFHSLVLTEDDEVYAFGGNWKGQLGLGDTTNRSTPTKLNSSNYGNKKITQVAAGTEHSLILTEDGEVYVFGNNGNGQLGLNDKTNRLVPTKIDSIQYKKITQVTYGDSHSLILTEDSKVYAFGGNWEGQLGLNDTKERLVPVKTDSIYYENKKITQISAGDSHSLILTEDGEVYAFGYNGFGELGLGDDKSRSVPIKIDSTYYGDKKIIQVFTGYKSSAILTEDSKVYAFGGNWKGQLGLGDETNRFVPTKINWR